MPEENNRREHPDARRDEGKSCGVIQDLKNIFDSFRGIFHKELPMSADGRVSRPSGSHFPATQGRVLRPKVHHLDLSITTV